MTYELTTQGWIMMIVSVGGVLCGVAWSFYRTLTLPPLEAEETLHGPPAIDTHDMG